MVQIGVSTDKPAVPPELLSGIIEEFRPRRIILFGSRARGTAHAGSDVDVLVVLDDDTPDDLFHFRHRQAAGRAFSGRADIIPCRAAMFEAKRNVIGSIVHEAATDGLTVYERQ